MSYRVLADIIVLIHFGFVLFVILGGILLYWWPKIFWVHVPVVIYAILIEWIGWICPLTPLENWLRHKGGTTGYSGGFVDHYILPLLYPINYTRTIQLWLGTGVLSVNLLVYSLVLYRLIRNKKSVA